MIDAGFRDQNCLEKMEHVLEELHISYEDLDVFLTHKHHDHSALQVYMLTGGQRST